MEYLETVVEYRPMGLQTVDIGIIVAHSDTTVSTKIILTKDKVISHMQLLVYCYRENCQRMQFWQCSET